MSAKKPKGPAKVQKNQYMQVFVRCRPPNDNEVNHRNVSPVDIQGPKDIVIQDRCNSKITKSYSFDKVFQPSSSQNDVYEAVVEPLIKDVLSGFNCTVFAYGQTGSGKTFTMEGEIGSEKMFAADSKAGLIPRAVCSLFDELRVLQAEYTVRISLLELYNEELYDLLSPDEVPPKLRMFDDATKKGSVIIQGLQEVMVHTQSQVLDELRKGSAKRQVAATLMNAQSSRSHTIFSVTVHSKESSVDGEELLKTGKLNLVDLAGSENIGRSGSLDKRAREAASINTSLLTLSRVTACLVEHQPHVPYRESKLTRLLQDSLGGRTKASLIATISPALSNVEETSSTLDYAHRAKSVANRPEVNQKISQTVVMKEYMDVIEDLKKKLDLTRNGSGVYMNDENYKQIRSQTQERNKEISDLISKIRAVGLLKKQIEETYTAFSKTHELELKNLENIENTIAQTSDEIGSASETLTKVKTEQNEAENLLENLVVKENELRSQADQLTNVVDVTQADSSKIHDKLEFSRVIQVENVAVLKTLKGKCKFHLDATDKLYSSVSKNIGMLGDFMRAIGTLDAGIKGHLASVTSSINAHAVNAAATFQKFQISMCKAVEVEKQINKNNHEDLLNLHLTRVHFVENCEKLLQGLCADFDRVISKFPGQITDWVNFVNNSAIKIKEVSKSKASEMTQHFDNIYLETDSNIQTVNNLLNNLLSARKKPLCEIADNVKEMLEKASAIQAICLKHHEDTATRKANLLKCEDNIVRKANAVEEQSTATVELLQQQQNDVSSNCKYMYDVFQENTIGLCHGVQEFVSSIDRTVSEGSDIVANLEKELNKDLSFDHLTPLSKVVAKNTDSRCENSQNLNNALSCSKDIVIEIEQLNHSLSSKCKELKHFSHSYEQKADEVLGMICEGVQSLSSDVLEQLESGKSAVNQLVSDEIKHDLPTGHTPNRKSYGPIPEPTSLPSPVARKIKPRIQRASWKKLLRSPRQPLLSTMSLQDIDDDCMASDSEVTVDKKKTLETIGLQKASSLCDLRSHAVFQRPRIPKKISRKKL